MNQGQNILCAVPYRDIFHTSLQSGRTIDSDSSIKVVKGVLPLKTEMTQEQKISHGMNLIDSTIIILAMKQQVYWCIVLSNVHKVSKSMFT